MKNLKNIALSLTAVLLAMTLMVSCGKQSPKAVATTWLNNFYHLDYDAAGKTSTEETKQLLSQLEQLAGYITDSAKKDMSKIVVTVKDVEEKGDTARVSYVLSDMPDKAQPLILVKKNGKWLVAFTKGNQLEAAEETVPEPPADDSTVVPADTTMQNNVKHDE